MTIETGTMNSGGARARRVRSRGHGRLPEFLSAIVPGDGAAKALGGKTRWESRGWESLVPPTPPALPVPPLRPAGQFGDTTKTEFRINGPPAQRLQAVRLLRPAPPRSLRRSLVPISRSASLAPWQVRVGGCQPSKPGMRLSASISTEPGRDVPRLRPSLCGTSRPSATGWPGGQQHGTICERAMLLNPLCPFNAARILALRATALLLLALLIKAKVRITAFSALGFALLLLQTLLFLVAGGALSLVAGAAGVYVMQGRRSAAI